MNDEDGQQFLGRRWEDKKLSLSLSLPFFLSLHFHTSFSTPPTSLYPVTLSNSSHHPSPLSPFLHFHPP